MVGSERRQAGGTDGSGGRRGQAHTLEAVAAALVLLSAVVFALQVTAVTPLSGSTSNLHIENQQENMAEGLLSAEADNGTLKETLLYYNTSSDGDRFYNATEGEEIYDGELPDTAFGNALDEVFLSRGIAVNVNLYYVRQDGERRDQRLVYLGGPSDHASTATWEVTLFEDDEIRDGDGSTGETVADAENFYAPQYGESAGIYNVIEVEVVTWRM